MPELPDLEIYKDNLYARLTCKRLAAVQVFAPQKVHAAQETLAQALVDETLAGIARNGKELFFRFTGDKALSVHLMLNGTIAVTQDARDLERIPGKILALSFAQETLVFSDVGGLCNIHYPARVSTVPDALSDAFTPAYWMTVARKHASANIKAFLIDQKVVRGIGNAYADEILWHARIAPQSIVGKIPQEAMARLHEDIGAVLLDAIESIRCIAPDIITGEVRSFLQVHNPSLRKTATGAPIRVAQVAQKTTYFTDEQARYV